MTFEQPALFDPSGVYGPAVRATDPDTSATAAEAASGNAETNRELALRLHDANPAGLTDFELADLAGIAQTSIGKRRGELVSLGLIERTELRRPAPSGTPAIVWRVTPYGRLYAAELRRRG